MQLIRKPNSQYWYYDFRIDGVRHRKSTGRPLSDKAGANRVMMAEYTRLQNVAQLGEKPGIRLSEAIALTLAETEGRTQVLYQSVLNKSLRDIGDVDLTKLSQATVDGLAAQRRRQGYKPNTIKTELKALARTMASAGRHHAVNRDINWPTIKAKPKTRYLSEDEERLVLKDLRVRAQETITAVKAEALFIVLIDTGMRLMEAVNLQWSDIDMARGRIEVYRSKTSTVSVVPMSDRVHQLMKRLHNQHQPFEHMEHAIRYLRAVIADHCNQNPVIIAQRGAATIHSLRDTFATRMITRGMSLYKLAKLLGHSTTAMTEKYSHLETQDVLEEARELLRKNA